MKHSADLTHAATTWYFVISLATGIALGSIFATGSSFGSSTHFNVGWFWGGLFLSLVSYLPVPLAFAAFNRHLENQSRLSTAPEPLPPSKR
ncbi:MAG: hypothetical protein CVT64_11405 [Actinobacteria bacterium HGW-Actinobacteria-4]|nr:MAG: hypothetical protein CVT64_11405 [Actinobacteria bacterium HGW-Actinobacteria-4]